MGKMFANYLIRKWAKAQMEIALYKYLELSIDEMNNFLDNKKLPGNFLKRHFDL